MKVLWAGLRFCRPPSAIWGSLETRSSLFQLWWPLIRRVTVITGGWAQRLGLFNQTQVHHLSTLTHSLVFYLLLCGNKNICRLQVARASHHLLQTSNDILGSNADSVPH